MRKLITLSLLALFFSVFVPNSFGQTSCPPAGIYRLGPASDAFNFISNPNPNSFDCWNHSQSVAFVTITSCSSPFANPITNNAFDMGYTSTLGHIVVVNQDIPIPASDTRNSFGLSYLLDFDDPFNNNLDKFSASVLDVTTNTFLYQSGTYNGSMADLFCQRFDSPTLMFSRGALAGHTIRVSFRGTIVDTDTHFRVYAVGFDGWTDPNRP